MPPEIREITIPATVRGGMFTNEVFVEVFSDDGGYSNGFAHENVVVRLPDGSARLRATRVATDSSGHEVVVLKFRPDQGVNQARFRPENLLDAPADDGRR